MTGSPKPTTPVSSSNPNPGAYSVRTRVAPSPTGFPHIGSMYQALFDYATAKKHNGTFVVRIEDTDQSRLVDGAEDAIYKALDWLGLKEDESPRVAGSYGPYKQSERLDLYKKHAEEIVEKGHAYYCFCTKERLDEVRSQQQANKVSPMYDKHCRTLSTQDVKSRLDRGDQFVIRMRIPETFEGSSKITLYDSLRGDIEFELALIDDQVLLKSDGFATYHLAVVVDDHYMKITHPIRGEEWIPSWPKHVLLYHAFGWEAPNYNHTPILRNPDRSKMSKRHSHTNISWYMEHGILPEALRNFMCLLGWSHPEGNEIFSFDEFIRLFDFKDVSPTGPAFDLNKLEWMNGEYIRMLPPRELADRIFAFMKMIGETSYDKQLIEFTIPLIQSRIKTLKEYDEYCRFFVEAPTDFEIDMTTSKDVLTAILDELALVHESNWHAEIIGEKLQSVAQKLDVPFSKFFMLVRVALTGKKVTPPTNESMEILGKEECMKRFSNALSA